MLVALVCNARVTSSQRWGKFCGIGGFLAVEKIPEVKKTTWTGGEGSKHHGA
jgi:hypothetical protein